MCDNRRYAPAAIADLQRITEAVEAERRRQYRSELAQELQRRLRSAKAEWVKLEGTHRGRGRLGAYREVEQWIDELSPPVVCDNPVE